MSHNLTDRELNDLVAAASPPRAPAEPIDICERLANDASGWEAAAAVADEHDTPPTRDGMVETAALEREAAAEIRRLREQVKTERRAGIEAAAQTAQKYRIEFEAAAHLGALVIERAIRALADKPAPDERKRCLEIVQRHIDAEVHATFANGATLQDAFTAGCEMTAKAIFDDIAGTQRFATPIVNIDGDVKQERFDAPFAARKGG